MLAALAAEMPATVSWNEPEGGYFLWLSLGVDAEELQRRAADEVSFVKEPTSSRRRARRPGGPARLQLRAS